MQTQLTILGCGTLGRNMVDGLLLASRSRPSKYRLSLTTRNPQQLSGLQRDFPSALVTADNQDPRIWRGGESANVHIVVIGTQPQYTAAVCHDIREACVGFQLGRAPVVITVCPGITVAQLEQKLLDKAPIVRSMPNTPVAVRQGATALCANRWVDVESMKEVEQIFRAIAPAVAVLENEGMMDVVAAVSG